MRNKSRLSWLKMMECFYKMKMRLTKKLKRKRKVQNNQMVMISSVTINPLQLKIITKPKQSKRKIKNKLKGLFTSMI